MYSPTSCSVSGCDSGSDEGRFPCTRCSAARWLCCSVESNCQARRGMGSEEEEESGGLVAVMLKYSFPASKDIWVGGGGGGGMGRQPQCTAVNAFSS